MSPYADRPRSHRLARTGFRACASFALAWLIATPAMAQSLADPTVRAGAASVSGLGTASVVVSQTSDKAVIDWRNFSVDAGTSVQFRQPGAGSIALNRITGTDATRIDGSLTGNGQVWLLNPNGVLIGSGGRVNVGGFVATTHSISNEDFLAGNYRFDGAGASGSIVNQGSIVADGGYAVLAGNRVANAGLVQARLGQVVLGAGKSFTVDLVGDKLLSFAVTQPVDIVAASNNLVSNSGVLSAQGGMVVMTARAAADVVGSVVNTTGLIDATAVRDEGGTIVLDGGDSGLVYAAGLIDASGKAAGQTGGRIGVFGDSVVVGAGALLDASGSAGGGAIHVGGGWQGASIDGHASSIRAGVNASAVLDASAIDAGNGGEITLWSDVTNAASQTLAYGTFLAKGGAGGGDGGRIETSGHYLDTTGVRGSAAAVSGTAGLWLFDPYNVEIVAAGAVGSGTQTDLFANGLTGWSIYNYDSRDTTTAATTFASTSGSYTSPVTPGGQFAVMTATPNGSYNYAEIYRTFTAATTTTVDIYSNYSVGGYVSGGVYGLAQVYDITNNQYVSSNYASTSSNGWQKQTLSVNAGDQYQIVSYAYDDTGIATSLRIALAAAVGSSGPNGSFTNTGTFQTWTPTGTPSKIDVSQITGFLNAGTNVRVTTTSAGSEAGNITVNAAIQKTAGAAATLQLDATNAIIVNQAIGSTTGALNVTLNAGAGGIALNNRVGTNGGTLTLNATGTTTQTAALTTSGLVLNGTGGNYALTNSGNSFSTLSGSTGTISIANAAAATTLGALAASGNLTIATGGTVTQTGALSATTLTLGGTGGAYTLTNSGNAFTTLSGSTGSASVYDSSATTVAGLATTGAFTLSSGGAIVVSGTDSFGGNATLAAATGTAITLASGAQVSTAGMLALQGATFVNNAGASAITTSGSGRWLIYSSTPVNDTFGGLASNNLAVWNQTPTSLAPASAPAGNRYIFALSPTLTVTPTSGHKTYGDTLGSTGRLYTTSGLVSASAYGDVFIQDTAPGTAQISSSGDAATAFVNNYTLNAAQGTLVVPQGYGVTYATGTLTVDKRALILAAATATKVYDGYATSTAAPTTSGLVNNNTVTNLSESYNGRDAGSRTLSVNTGYTVNDGNNGNNYTVSLQSATGTITPKTLTLAAATATKVYDGYATTTAAPSASGLAANDTVSNLAESYDSRNAGARTLSVNTGYTVNDGNGGGNYAVTLQTATGTITAKALTASLAGSVAKTYDGGTTATLANGNYALSGVVNTDNVALNNPTSGSYDTKNVGTGKTVSVTGLSLTGSDTSNYTVNAGASASIGSITAKMLTASLIGSVTKTYDGSATATLASGNYALAGVVGSENVTLNNPTAGNYDTKNVGTGKTVSVAGLALAGSDASNYAVNTNASANVGSITAKMLTASLIGSVTKTYDGSATATLASGNYTLAGVVGSENVALNNPTTGNYDTKNVGTGKTVSVAGLALAGSDASNYAVNTNASANVGSITAKMLTASLIGSVTKTYDGSATATLASGNYALAGVVGSENVALNNPTGGNYDTKNVGMGKTVSIAGLALTGTDASNYTVNAGASASIGSIAAKMLTASLTGSVAKTYDGGTAATLASGNYALTGGVVTGENVALNNPTSGSYDTKDIGAGKAVTVAGLALTGTDASNYTVNAGASASIGSIAAKMLTASLTGSVAKTYDGGTAATLAGGNYALANTVSTDDVALNNPTSGTYDTRNVGVGKAVTVTGLALTGTDAANYTVNASASANVGSIAQRALILAATTASKVYDGAATTTAAPTISGLVGGDAVGNLSESYDSRNAGNRTLAVNTGYTVNDGNGGGNYAVSLQTASGTITPKALSAGLTGSVAKTYDGTVAAALAGGNYVLSGVVNTDNVALNNPTGGTYDTKNAGTSKTVSVSGLALTGGDAGNYTVNTSASAAIGSVAQRALTAGLTGNVAKTYDGTTAAALVAGNYTLANTVQGDSIALNNPTSGSYDTKNAGSGKTVLVAGLALTGSDAGNYTVNASASAAVGSVAQRALTAGLTGNVAKTYDGTTAAALVAGNYTLANTVQGDSIALNNPTGGSYDTKNAGTGKTVTVAGLALTGGDAGNYTVNTSTSAAIGSIAQRALTAGLTGAVAKTYDGTTAATLAASNYTLANTVQGDSIALNNPTGGSYDTKNAGSGKTVSVAGLSLTGGDVGNYTVNATANAAIGSVAQRALTAGLTGNVAKTYDGTVAAALTANNYTLANTVQGDSVALNNPTGGTYDTKNAGTGKTVSVAGLALTGGDANNYTVNATANASIGSVAQRALTAGLTGNVAKTYDGTTAATLADGNYTVANTVQGDSIALNNPTGGSYDTKNAGTGKTVSVAGLALTGGDAGNYIVNTSASAAVGSVAQRALTAGLTGTVTKTYDGTTAATLVAGNYTLANTVQGDSIALNNPTGGSFDTKNASSGKTVSVAGLALTGGDAGNYTVNASASAGIGSIAAKALDVQLTGNVSRTANGSTAATLTPDNYALTGFVSGESAIVTETVGQYSTASAGTDITVSTTLAGSDFQPASSTSLANYVLPVGPVSGRIGTISPQVMTTVAAQPVVPVTVSAPAAATASIAAQPVVPATPVAPSDAPAATPVVAVASSVGAPVAASPPSPVAATKPATPPDSADAGDPILATVAAPSDKPASHSSRQSSVNVPIAGGLLSEQRALPPHADQVPGVDQPFSGSGAAF